MNLNVSTTTGATGIKIRPGRRFMRLDRQFNDAVRSQSRSAIIDVLLRVPLSADKARRTAKKILAERTAA